MTISHLIYHHSMYLPLIQGLIAYDRELCSISHQSDDFSLICFSLGGAAASTTLPLQILHRYHMVEILNNSADSLSHLFICQRDTFFAC